MIEDLRIEKTSKTPEVLFSASDKRLVLFGRSRSEDPHKFYVPVYDLLDKMKTENSDKLELLFKLYYMNTSSSKCIYRILKSVKDLIDQGCKVQLEWYYMEDDDDMVELGEDLSFPLGLDIRFVEVEELD